MPPGTRAPARYTQRHTYTYTLYYSYIAAILRYELQLLAARTHVHVGRPGVGVGV